MCICIRTHVRTYMCVHELTYIYIHTYGRSYVHVCMYECTYQLLTYKLNSNTVRHHDPFVSKMLYYPSQTRQATFISRKK